MKRNVYLTTLVVVALFLVGCTSTQEPAEPVEIEVEVTREVEVEVEVEVEAEEAMEEEMALPGEGITVRQGQPTWDTEWFQAQVYKALLEDLGYTVEEPVSLDNATFFLSAANGDMDFWASGWFPLHNTFIDDEKVTGKAVRVGMQAPNGGLMGYLIDKKTADENGVTDLTDLADPEIAALFDNDGDGKADLMGCDPGWGCELVINYHLEDFGLEDTVTHEQGSYSALLADTYARIQREEPVLFLTWTPNWTVGLMVPGEDVVWLETPYYSVPDDQRSEGDEDNGSIAGVVGCASGNDPCNLGIAANNIQIVANQEFLDANPAANSLFESVKFELADISTQNGLMFNGEDSVDDIARHAADWIEANRSAVDGWLADAIAAAG